MKYVAKGYSLTESPKGIVSYNCTETKAYIESSPMELAEAGFGTVPGGESTKEVYQDHIYTCKYCSFRYRIHHNKNYQTVFFNDFLKRLESNCPARPKEKSNE